MTSRTSRGGGAQPGSTPTAGAEAGGGRAETPRSESRSEGQGPLPQGARGRAPAAGLIVLLCYVFVALYLVPVFPHGASANEQTRWATAAAIVDRGSFEISWAEPFFGPNPDTARVGDRLYSNKAPGAAILALPGYAVVRAVQGPPTASNVRTSWTAMRWIIATLPLVGLALYFRARRATPFVLVLVLFATPLFIYSLLLFSHVLAGVAVFFAYVLLFGGADSSDSPQPPPPRTGGSRENEPIPRGSQGGPAAGGSTSTRKEEGASEEGEGLMGRETRGAPEGRALPRFFGPPWSTLAAGLLAAVAVSAEFAVVVPVLVLGVGLLLRGDRPVAERAREALRFGLGGLPCALLLALYNKTLFGSYFSLSYAHEAFQEWADVAQRGVFGIGVPTPANLWLILLSPKRGLFFLAPVLALGAIDLFRGIGRTRGALATKPRAAADPSGTRRRGTERASRRNASEREGRRGRGDGGRSDSLSREIGEEAHRRRVRLVIVAASVLVIAGHGAAHGGWAPGPRYLLFIVPFLLEALLESPLITALSLSSARSASATATSPARSGSVPVHADLPSASLWFPGLLAGASVVLCVLPALTFPFSPPEFHFPHNSFWRPLLLDGWATPTLGAMVGLGSGPLALVPALVAIAAALILALFAAADLLTGPNPRSAASRVTTSKSSSSSRESEQSASMPDPGREASSTKARAMDGRALAGDGGREGSLDETRRLQARRGSILAAAVALGAVAASVYTIAPGLDEPDGPARRAAIEDRFFRPDGRIADVRSRTTDPNQLRYLDTMDWQVAEVAASAPDGWPYSRQPLAKARPGDAQKRATALVQEKKLDEARTELLAARETFPFARCDFTDDLSVVLYLSGRKDEAIAELESVRPLARTRTSPGCRKSLFHLGSLYLERGRSEDAAAALREYLALTEGYQDADTVKNRQAAAALVQRVR